MSTSYTPSMNAFTCVSCGKLVFASSEEQKEHFKSDFHRFNLKRKSVGLPPVSEEAFNAKVQQDEAKESEARSKKNQASTPAQGKKAKAKGKGKHERNTAVAVPKDTPESAAAAAASVEVPDDKPAAKEQNVEIETKEKEEQKETEAEAAEEEEEEEEEDNQEEEKEEEDVKEKKRKPFRYSCAVCGKRFRSPQAFNIHYSSRKHRGRALAAGVSPDPPEEMVALAQAQEEAHAARFPLQHPENFTDEELMQAIQARPRMAPNECLFCGLISDTFEESLDHMADAHGFYVPDLDYCIDLEGLIKYLAEKVAVWTRCLWCPDTTRSFYTTEAARQHMREAGHCKLAFELEDMPEYAQFYDWSECEFPRGDGRVKAAPFEVADNGYELMLPDGRIIGHRELKGFYSQKIHAPEMRDSVIANMRAQAARLRIAQAGGSSTALVPSAGLHPYVRQTTSLTKSQYYEKTRAILTREGKNRLKVDLNSKKIIKIEFYC